MGLIKAVLAATSGAFAEQWKEYFYCDSLDQDTLVVKGKKKNRNGSNTSTDNIISAGSKIVVNEGQCAIIVDQGVITEFVAEPGEFYFDTSSQPTIFNGTLKESVGTLFDSITERFTYGGDIGSDQRVYYINIKEIPNNKFGTPSPITFRIYDKNANFDMDVGIRCNGIYSYKITNPILFFKNVCANVTTQFDRSEIDEQLKTSFVNALQPALGKLSALAIRPSAIPMHVTELCDALNEVLSQDWGELRGIDVVDVALNPITMREEDEEMLREAQRVAMLRDPEIGHARLLDAQAEAMKMAAQNEGGAAIGFMGMNMAMNAGGNAAGQYAANVTGANVAGPGALQANADGWKCECGAINTGKFCQECGKAKPVVETWKCECGAENTGKFCQECGKPKVQGPKKCGKCGFEVGPNVKFCPECGNPL